jgi:sec-independent protein translocase protein TatC
VAGCALAYYILPHALGFLQRVGGPSLKEIYNPNQYLSLILLMMVLFGLTFEFPVILVALEMVGVVSSTQLLHWWRWAVIAITVVAGVFTPSSDPFSMMALALPLVGFYFVSILIGKLLGR